MQREEKCPFKTRLPSIILIRSLGFEVFGVQRRRVALPLLTSHKYIVGHVQSSDDDKPNT